MPYRHLAGLEPERLTARQLKLYSGSIADGNGVVWEVPNPLTINIDATGALGRDATKSLTQNSFWIPIIIRNTSTDAISAFISTGFGWGDFTIPAGYTAVRQLPWAFIYKSSWGSGSGIAPFHLEGWPKPTTHYTDFEMAAPWLAVNNGKTNGSWRTVSLAPWLPDPARLGHLCFQVIAKNRAGSLYVRNGASISAGVQMATCRPGELPRVQYLPIRVASDMTIDYKTTGDAYASIGIEGYTFTSPN